MFIENEYTELKSELTKEIKKEIIAFANSKGGTIYIGVNDDGSVCGLKNVAQDMEALSGMIREGIKSDLSLYTSIEMKEIDNKNIIELKIMSAPNKPYYLSEKGLKSNGVFIRHGNVSAPASEENIIKMVRENHDTFENEISSNQNLTFKFLTDEFNNKNIDFNESKYKILNLKNDDNYFTNLALLLSDECPFSIKCAIFEGNDKIAFKDRKEFSGSIVKQLEDCLEYLNLVNKISGRIVNYQRIDIRDYPEYAIRETLLNAIIHRNYNFSGSILISIFDNRIEVTSLGGLVSGITLDDIITSSVSQPRNKNLANIFYRLNYVESFGTGIGRMLDIYEQFNLKPIFTITDNAFKVTLPNVNYKQSKKDIIRDTLNQKEEIIKYLEQYGKIKRENVDRLFDISSTRSKNILSEMVKDNLISMDGNGKNTYYVLKHK
jgi:ATP-dependent DNA helicase RecG